MSSALGVAADRLGLRLHQLLADGRLARVATWLFAMMLVAALWQRAATTRVLVTAVLAAGVFLAWESAADRLGRWGALVGATLVVGGLALGDYTAISLGTPVLALCLPTRAGVAAVAAALGLTILMLWSSPPPTPAVPAVFASNVFNMLIIYLFLRVASTARRLRDTCEDLARTEVDAEHDRLAQELNALIGQTLHQVGHQVSEARTAITVDDPEISDQLAEVDALVRRGLDQLRLLSFEAVLDDLETEVQTALTLCRRLGVDFAAAVDQVDDAVGPTFALLLRESVTNMFKHALPTRCTLVARDEEGEWLFSFTNDGVCEATPRSSAGSGQHRWRTAVEELGGTLDAAPLTGGRYRVVVRIPLTSPMARSTGPSPDQQFERSTHG